MTDDPTFWAQSRHVPQFDQDLGLFGLFGLLGLLDPLLKETMKARRAGYEDSPRR
jgi:hypothetical protein